MYVEKAAETTFVQKKHAKNVLIKKLRSSFIHLGQWFSTFFLNYNTSKNNGQNFDKSTVSAYSIWYLTVP